MIVISPTTSLLPPGWQNSGPDHWQTAGKAHGYHRVEQHDWMRPLRGDWSAPGRDRGRRRRPGGAGGAQPGLHPHRLVGGPRATPPRCAAPCWWPQAMWSGLTWPAQITAGRPLRAPAAAVPALLVGSRNDPYCSFERAEGLAAWGAAGGLRRTWGTSMRESGLELGRWPLAHPCRRDTWAFGPRPEAWPCRNRHGTGPGPRRRQCPAARRCPNYAEVRHGEDEGAVCRLMAI